MSLLSQEVPHAEIPGLLSAMGVINTVAAFAFSTAFNRIAGVKYRRLAAQALLLAWLAVALLVAAYICGSLGWHAGVLVDFGLAIWAASVPLVLLSIYSASRDTVGRGRRANEVNLGFENRFYQADFGVPIIDNAIRRAIGEGRRVVYPMLLVHDYSSPGLDVVGRFVRTGLRAGEAIVYLTFSRPHTIVRDGTREQMEGREPDRLLIVDCYAPLYWPEAGLAADGKVVFADPRNPREVYNAYMDSLVAARRLAPSVRVVYESFSDFAKVADADLIMHYVRRVVVLEELRRIRALYVFWEGISQGGIDTTYLKWFFSRAIDIKRKDAMPAKLSYGVRVERFFSDPVEFTTGAALEVHDHELFQVSGERVGLLATRMRTLDYKPRPYGFLPQYAGEAPPRQITNFVFFMVAIDHDTARGAVRYQGVIDGRALHGSDLLFALAERAKAADPNLFLPASMAAIGTDAVRDMFTTSDGLTPADVEGRAEIFRATAVVLNEHYREDALALLAASEGRLGGQGGLLQRLRRFAAYADPVGKKANLLCKVVMRDGLLAPADPEALEIAVDHVIVTMALRSGIVQCREAGLLAEIAEGAPLDGYRTSVLRDATRDAMRALVREAQIGADRVDDLFWSYGREALRRATPLDAPEAVRSALDPQLKTAELPAFVAMLNGLDAAADPSWKQFRPVRGPFTRFY